MTAHADPWLAPGNEGLRSDIQLLADAGILRGPVTTWPMSWPDIARDVISAEEKGLEKEQACRPHPWAAPEPWQDIFAD